MHPNCLQELFSVNDQSKGYRLLVKEKKRASSTNNLNMNSVFFRCVLCHIIGMRKFINLGTLLSMISGTINIK